jgi:FSR family fosmidomycin resistance protein-like MFS transporter
MQLPTHRLFWAVSLGHAANDLFMSMRSVVLTFISAYVLPISAQQISLAVSAIELCGALSQPFFGRRADRSGGRWLGAGGITWTASFMLLGMLAVTLGGGFWLMLILMALAGFGSGAFHPVGSMYSTDVDPLRAGRNAALFFMFGQIGLALGPMLSGLLLDRSHTTLNVWFGAALGTLGPRLFERGSLLPLFALGVIIIPAAVLMALTIPSRAASLAHSARSESTSRTPAASVAPRAFAILGLAVALRSMAHLSTVNFLPYMFQLKGWSPAEYGALASSFWIASGFAGVWFGSLGDRYDMRRVIMFSLIVTAPVVFLIPDLNGLLAVAGAFVIGAMSGSHSLIVVLSQRLLPGKKGFASGAILGFIFAAGAISNLIVGGLIDRFGAVSTFHVIAVLTLASSLLWLLIPAASYKRQPPQPVAEPAASSG